MPWDWNQTKHWRPVYCACLPTSARPRPSIAPWRSPGVIQAGGELREALEVVQQALGTYPNEQRLLQMHVSVQKSLQEARRKDLEQARRIAREVDTATDLNEERLGQYSDRLEYYMTQYGDDREFHDLVHGAKKRLETIVEARPPQRGSGAEGSGGSAPAQILDRTAETVDMAHTIGGASPPPVRDRKLSAALEGVRRRIAGLKQPWTSKQIYVGTAAAAAVILLIGIAVREFSKPRPKPQPAPPAEGSVAISSVPLGATISVNGEKAGSASGANT